MVETRKAIPSVSRLRRGILGPSNGPVFFAKPRILFPGAGSSLPGILEVRESTLRRSFGFACHCRAGPQGANPRGRSEGHTWLNSQVGTGCQKLEIGTSLRKLGLLSCRTESHTTPERPSSKSAPAERAYLPLHAHFFRALPRILKLPEGRVAAARLEFISLGWVAFELPDELLHPSMRNSEPSGPRTRRRPFAASRIPPKHQSANHLAFLRTPPRPRRMV